METITIVFDIGLTTVHFVGLVPVEMTGYDPAASWLQARRSAD